MKAIRLFPSEFRRLLQSPLTGPIALLTLLSPLAGLFLYKPASASTMHTMYLANPALAGGTAGGILFALLTVFELDRTVRSRANLLIDGAVSPVTMAQTRLLALMAAASLTFILTALVWFPITRNLTGQIFDSQSYLLAYSIFMGLCLPIAVLAAASAYQFTGRTDLALALFALFSGLSLTVWSDHWQLCWLNPCVWALSDDFSNFRIFRSVSFMRLTWFGILLGIWLLSCLCIRQYGKGLLGSLACRLRQFWRPVAALLLLACSAAAWAAQPFVDHSNPDETIMSFDQIAFPQGVSCLSRTARVYPNTATGTVTAQASFRFRNTSGQPQTVAFGINPGYRVSSVQANGSDVPFLIDDYQEYNEALLEAEIPAGEETELVIEYGGFPQESRSMAAMQGRLEISREYLCLENAALAPRLINAPIDGGIYPTIVEITLPRHMTVIPFCASDAEIVAEPGSDTFTWRYQYNGTGGILYAGDYVRQDIEAGGITIQLYYGRRHQTVMEASRAAEAVKAVADYCTEHYGPLSFGGEGSLKLIQSRVTGGGYAANGASLLDEADFTAANLADSAKGAIPGEVMIHELVHQWWGLANMFDPSDPDDPWSAEGLTVYTTYRIVKDIWGEEYAAEHYVKEWQKAVRDYYGNFYVRNPEYLTALPEKERLKISNSLSSVRQYSEMPLKILKAQDLVGGEEAMDAILHELFNRDLDWTYPYLTYEEFLDACGLAKEDLNLE